MGWWKRTFGRRKGGRRVGNAIRRLLFQKTHGLLGRSQQEIASGNINNDVPEGETRW